MAEKEIKYYRRYHGYDYAKGASLFITMVTDPRRALFGRVVDAKVAKGAIDLPNAKVIFRLPPRAFPSAYAIRQNRPMLRESSDLDPLVYPNPMRGLVHLDA